MRWRALPIFTVLAIAGVMFWGLMTVFGSESSRDEDQTSLVTAAGADSLPRIPLAFPEVAKPLMEALPTPSPEPSPEPPVVTTAAKKPATTKTRAVKVPTDGATGSAVTGESGDATIGPTNRTPATGDETDPVGDLDSDFENPDSFGPDKPDDDPPKEPEQPKEPEVDDESSGGVDSGDSGNNGANGSSETQTDPGTSDEGND